MNKTKEEKLSLLLPQATPAALKCLAFKKHNLDNLEEEISSLKAKLALDVGGIFYVDREVIGYNKLGIGRLIYQLPENLCRLFMEEIFPTS